MSRVGIPPDAVAVGQARTEALTQPFSSLRVRRRVTLDVRNGPASELIDVLRGGGQVIVPPDAQATKDLGVEHRPAP